MKGLTVLSLFIELREDPNSAPTILVSRGLVQAPIVQSNPSAKIWRATESSWAVGYPPYQITILFYTIS
jgi:hypothetical protein